MEIEKLIDISDSAYTFCEIVDHIDLSKYFVMKGYKIGTQVVINKKYLK